MTGVRIEEKGIGRQMWDLLERKPEKNDVVFSVGVTKVKVGAVKLVLEAASPIFEEYFEKKWDTAVIKDTEGIPLVDVDPVAFQLFVKLVTLDTWSSEVLKALRVSLNTFLALTSICRRFQVTKAIKNLEEAAKEFVRSFNENKQKEFLEMSQSNLAKVISSEHIVLKEIIIFADVCRWAEFQCAQKGIEKSGENMRGVLGPVLFEIRFPRMSSTEFSKVCRRHNNLLTQVERLAIYDFIGMDDQEKQKYDGSQLPFKTHPRGQPKTNSKVVSTLCLTKNRNIVDSLPFVCHGNDSGNWLWFQISGGRIALHGIGFLGPNDEDCFFDVAVRMKRSINYSVASDSGEKKKRVFARKREIFYFMFDEPITIEQSDCASVWNYDDYYGVWIWMKGPNTMAVDRNYGCEEAAEETGVKFRFYWWTGRNQFAELLYKKL